MRPTTFSNHDQPLPTAPVNFRIAVQPSPPINSGPSVRSRPRERSDRLMPDMFPRDQRVDPEVLIRRGYREPLRRWLAAGGNPDSIASSRMSILGIAVHCRQYAIVELLLRHGANPNLADRFGEYPLMYAARAGDERIAHALLRGGALPNIKTPLGTTALQAALKHERTDVVIVLLQGGADTDLCGVSIVDIVKLLDKTDPERHAPRVEALFRQKMRLEQMPQDMPLFWYCAQEGLFDCLKILIRYGHEIPTTTWRNLTPELLAYWGGHSKLVNWLLAIGKKKPGPWPEPGAVFLNAAFAGDVSTLAYLLDRFGVDVNHTDGKGITALHQAAMGGHLRAVRFLHGRGANMLALCKNLSNAAQYFALSGNLEGVRYMVEEHGIGLEHRNLDGDTLMHFAAHWGHLPILVYLEARGANPYALNVDVETPEDMARAKYSRKTDPALLAKRGNTSFAAEALAHRRQHKPAPCNPPPAPAAEESAALLKRLQDALEIGNDKQAREKLVKEALILGARPTEEMLARARQNAKMAWSLATWRPEYSDDAMSAKRIIHLLMDSLGWQMYPAGVDPVQEARKAGTETASYTPIRQQPMRRNGEMPTSEAPAMPPHQPVSGHGASSSSTSSARPEDDALDWVLQFTESEASSSMPSAQEPWQTNPFALATPPTSPTIFASGADLAETAEFESDDYWFR